MSQCKREALALAEERQDRASAGAETEVPAWRQALQEKFDREWDVSVEIFKKKAPASPSGWPTDEEGEEDLESSPSSGEDW